MKVRIVTIRPEPEVDPFDEFVASARAIQRKAGTSVDGLSLRFSAPDYGWIEMWLTVDGHIVDWWIPDLPDPFGLPWKMDRYEVRLRFRDDSDERSVTFLHWLEAIAGGGSAAIGFDMEGPLGALLVSGEPASREVRFSAVDDRGEIAFVVTIDRFVLVRDIYAALIAYWEGEALNAAWGHWSKLPKWSLRSGVLEEYLVFEPSRR